MKNGMTRDLSHKEWLERERTEAWRVARAWECACFVTWVAVLAIGVGVLAGS